MHALTDNFSAFLKRINPSPTYEKNASSAYNNVKQILESDEDMKELAPHVFLQGSYKRDTAIYTINDVDIVVLCTNLHYPPSSGPARSWSRDEIFSTVAGAIKSNSLYKDKVKYDSRSKCIKVETSVGLDVLPVVRSQGHHDVRYEPVFMYHPDYGKWVETYARYHQEYCSEKNKYSNGNFIPMIKITKHLRDSTSGLSSDIAPSFYIECLLYDIDNGKYSNTLALSIVEVLVAVAMNYAPDSIYKIGLNSPCGDRQILSLKEWAQADYEVFYKHTIAWAKLAIEALKENDREKAITKWKRLLGDAYFPRYVE